LNLGETIAITMSLKALVKSAAVSDTCIFVSSSISLTVGASLTTGQVGVFALMIAQALPSKAIQIETNVAVVEGGIWVNASCAKSANSDYLICRDIVTIQCQRAVVWRR